MKSQHTFLDHAEERYNSNDVAWAWIKRKEAELEARIQGDDRLTFIVHHLRNSFSPDQILTMLSILKSAGEEFDREVKARNNE